MTELRGDPHPFEAGGEGLLCEGTLGCVINGLKGV